MKKILGIMVAGLLLLGFAGQSMAAFATGDLIRVVYDSTNQYVTDLGSLNSLEALTSTTQVGDQFYRHLERNCSGVCEQLCRPAGGLLRVWGNLV